MDEEHVTRRLSAILAADVAGFSGLMETDEEGTLARLNAHRHELIDRKITEHRGRIVKLMGDGLLVEFSSVVDAVRCAVEVQRGMAERNDGEKPDQRIRFRIGINLGDIIVEGDDIYGDGVNVAARLQTLAEPGGICVSRTVAEQVQDKLNFAFQNMGAQTVKNITRPIQVLRVLLDADATARPRPSRPQGRRRLWPSAAAGALVAVVVAGVVWYLLPARNAAPTAGARPPVSIARANGPSIAVLPLVNLTGNPQQNELGDGLTEDILTELAQVPDVAIASHNATAGYSGEAVNLAKVSRDLGVRYVLTGSIRSAGDQLRVTVQLIEAMGGSQVWAARYDRLSAEALKAQDELTEAITTQLIVQMRRRDLELIKRKPPETLGAYDYYLLGRDALARDDFQGDDTARAMFDKAVASNPDYAPAYGGRAATYFREFYLRRGDLKSDAALERAFNTAQRSLSLNTSVSDALYVVAGVYLFRRQYDEAFALLNRAIARTADDTDLIERLGEAYIFSGAAQKGINALLRMMSLNPFHGPAVFAHLARGYLLLDRIDDAVSQAEICASRAPEYRPCYEVEAVAYTEKGLLGRARDAVARIQKLDPGYTLQTAPRMMPFRNSPDLERFLDGLRKAGLS
jgi:adenylate cyclase